MAQKKDKKPDQTITQPPTERGGIFHPRFISGLADEVAKLVVARLPRLPERKSSKGGSTLGRKKEAIGGLFLDTSAIIDGRISDAICLGLFHGPIIVIESILLELKHIADSKDPIKKARGRRALEKLSKVRKTRGIKFLTIAEDPLLKQKHKEVDELLLEVAKQYKGRLITCDYNLEKKAHVMNVTAINVHALAQVLKIAAVPGETLEIKLQHVGKDVTQGVGYLDDGTMIVVEKAASLVGSTVHVVVSRVIQTSSGKILFAKKI